MRRDVPIALVILTGLGLSLAVPAAGLEPPVPVSPGAMEQVQGTAQACPTFIWGAVEGAQAYEIEIFRVLPRHLGRSGGIEAEPAEHMLESFPVLRATIPAAASAWTPAADQCLGYGLTYLWRVREVAEHGAFAGEWSQGSWFQVSGEAEKIPTEIETEPDELAASSPGHRAILRRLNRRLDEIERKIDRNQFLLSRRLDEIDGNMNARFGRVIRDLSDVEEAAWAGKPCTLQRLSEGKCNPWNITTTLCFTMKSDGQYSKKLGTAAEFKGQGGAGWDEVGHVRVFARLEGVANAGFDISAAAEFGMPICIAGWTTDFARGRQASLDGLNGNDFAHMATSLETNGPEIAQAMRTFALEKKMTGDRAANLVQALGDLEITLEDAKTPITSLRNTSGSLREFIEELQPGDGVTDLLDGVESLVPKFNNPRDICNNPPDLPGTAVADICGVVDEMPDLEEVANTVNTLKDLVCRLPALRCLPRCGGDGCS